MGPRQIRRQWWGSQAQLLSTRHFKLTASQDADHASHDGVQNETSPKICRELEICLSLEWGTGGLTGDYRELNGTKIRVENVHYELSREDLVV